MPAQMIILGWTAKGLRCPDHTLNLTDEHGDPYKVSLLQMPNGTGKTTTLDLIRSALSGAAAGTNSWPPSHVRSFQKKESEHQQGSFELRLMLNDHRVTIIMEFDFGRGIVHYKTTRGGGQVERFDPPFDFRKFMSEEFVNFYIFDGELAERLLSREHTNAETVVEHLFQINTLQILSEKVAEYWEKKTADTTATEERGYSRRKNRVDKLKTWLDKIEREKDELEKKREQLAEKFEWQKNRHEQEIKKESERSGRLTQAQTREKELEAEANRQSLAVLDIMTKPYALAPQFAEDIFELKQGLDRVKLPESAAREFFEELAEEQECVCGRPICEEEREAIRSRASRYLGSDDVSLLNSMKTAIDDAVGRSRTSPETELNAMLEELAKTVHQHRRAQNELTQLKNDAADTDPTVRKAADEVTRLEGELHIVENELAKYDSLDQHLGDESYGIKVIRERLEEAEYKLSEITETISLKEKRDTLRRILDLAHQKARDGVTAEICTEANERTRRLMPYNDIRIERIDRSLVLDGQEGGSVGEQLSVAYAFLSTLFNRSDHQLSFVVDSPANPIDLAIRPQIGKLVPKLSTQFIAFTISSERDGFVPSLKEASGSSIQFITLFRKGAPHLDAKAKSTTAYEETLDGMIVFDEAFFNDFQEEELLADFQDSPE